ncbi:MAG: 2-C-methyl-D-erythritol 2,4-cyclodiphosphate synthase, partial [Clostridia bacterium]|nr:2-C-methyl-D-erythritol 2,4-cyclodiphosphate synthase [Clostridia bacterium]
MRTGTGFDSHRLAEGRKLILAGVEIPFEKGLLGHSDADVLTHAVIDALFGACALGDIGSHFPDSDPAYKDANSISLLEKTADIISENGFTAGNIDVTVIIERPKLLPYIPEMRKNIARALKTDIGNISIKAKTNEGLGDIGLGNAAAAICSA